MGEKFIKVLKIILRGIFEIVYPKDTKCIICREVEAEGICDKCKNKIVSPKDEELCLGYYAGPVKQLILDLKYKRDFNAGEVLVRLMEERLSNINKEFYLTFIPISRRTLQERGFNQCEYIAREFAFRNNFKVMDTLEKIKDTEEQKNLNKEERALNLIGCFRLKDKIEVKNRKFVLIDDVITTGATSKEAIKVLKENGAIEIKILTLAKSHI